MSKTKKKHIRIEETPMGDRLVLNPSDGDTFARVIDKCRKIAKYSEIGSLESNAETAVVLLEAISVEYGFMVQLGPSDGVAADAAGDVVNEQSP